ncbi:hypothetical protein HCN44_010171 [Aphidius gifuensis]|uniref:Prolyl 4-hydroxylase alpha subunit Fe(2+) 2OG dioxygenase domain-containing protein n=1 Tax=Aphidius gifuensis TaxID=684658 RepID=A0A834XWV6_APHGI|nr:uncharacterized protein LOC122851756 [Aphidius gifuensis]KAF7993576.1 hypothetical protein HCN44_010171 [Aphidius gifuensis]
MAQNNDGPSNKKRKLDNDEIKSVCDLLSIRVGKLNIGKNQKITLFVDNMKMDAMNISQDEYAHLDKSYFSRNTENIIDMDCCKYKQTKNFDIDLDIETILKTINIKGNINPYTLNYYKTGDLKASHHHGYRQGLKGTLILLLPSECVGGDYCYDDYNVEKNMDKSTLRFVYFNDGMEHSVTKVSSGNRLSLVYNVYDPNHQRKNVIGSYNTVIYFPDEHYKKLLNYTINYCQGKENILLGYYEHRDAAFNERLRRDIEAKYRVIKVAVEKDSSISQVTRVHALKDDLYEDDKFSLAERGGRKKDFSDLVDEEFAVRHRLFTKHCALKYKKIDLTIEYGYRKRWPIEKHYSVDIYTAYLINPNSDYYSSDDDDTD